MPVLFAWLEGDALAGADELDRAAAALGEGGCPRRNARYDLRDLPGGRAVGSEAVRNALLGSGREAAETRRIARDAERRVIVSARSGETEDDWLSDLAVGWRADLIKIGSIRQSCGLAK